MRSLLVVSLIFLVVTISTINAQVNNGMIRGRLLTPEEGCGFTPKSAAPRIVGGANARKGINRSKV